jgi:hypothetical protein
MEIVPYPPMKLARLSQYLTQSNANNQKLQAFAAMSQRSGR